ncbi:16S rRNA (cytidine(1402)-2'-O)-methyltransferase [Leptospira levettii]|uniref:Ribosomal RNA small subunit methyltransferase I n=1 Tax=Leptospira levettii TaxID=2023178 RepID=A0A2N0AZ94_9LEPT|nr:16S rRNA (cytidine(1402)-2'-O)-methyltransferase [Leptospira levettii]PKA25950.1 16S rRNA (cytidine(1402)-2'-O)-methyltransferase [Leptospira sp. mixed culture ATI2-C-A1]MCG6148536.1 16S rRNA (cytidine(1402)-2'-O)-methyltransferase [Leptospira levettii]MCW7464184.1 16S rRNA (cytidine(1402)-2'-O)-methyltransferase [Leptospira levettii]MCW7472777.1 16S rRNA (cytidine(1402)-2'-O)-methyltransferase [Leptospira levettii]MCW7495747.1 16S rRNA (cytidine(1402)-2'-O)-methyltransferase [Leptospira le
MAHKRESGNLYVVATPIGNMGDITLRAIEVFKEVELVLCESTKETKSLFHKLGIVTPVLALYKDHSESPYANVLDQLKKGKSMALVSDAGTPGVSDPGSQMVRTARENGIAIIPVPGASALTALLSVSGFQVNPTYFLGFLSEKPSKKRRELEKAKEIEGLIVFYESVHKLPRLYPLLEELYPETEVLVGRELTKAFEEVLYYANPRELAEKPPNAKGEFVFLLNHRKKSLKGNSDSSDM